MTNTILFAILVMFVVTLILVALLLWIKSALTPSGSVKVSINGGSKELEVTPGGDLMHTLADHGIFLPSACRSRTAGASAARSRSKTTSRSPFRNPPSA